MVRIITLKISIPEGTEISQNRTTFGICLYPTLILTLPSNVAVDSCEVVNPNPEVQQDKTPLLFGDR